MCYFSVFSVVVVETIGVKSAILTIDCIKHIWMWNANMCYFSAFSVVGKEKQKCVSSFPNPSAGLKTEEVDFPYILPIFQRIS